MKSIFIISQYPMFGQGLKSLLQQQADLDIVGWETDLDEAIKQIKELQPEIVLLESDRSFPGVSPILQASPDSKVINLNLHSTRLYLYQARQWTAKSLEDLMQVIHE
jgi:DNA-binding NarL/FixJ family response regulator